MSNLVVNYELCTDDITEALMNDLTVDELQDFILDLLDKTSDNDLNNTLYEELKIKHSEYLEFMGIDETKYREEFADPTYYEDEDDDEVDDDEDEHWTINDEVDDELEEDVDVFTTEDDK
jgi:hypothetical protein